jgi:hypothetical protein
MDGSDTSRFIRSRAKTVQSVAISETVDPDALPLSLSGNEDEQTSGPDLFEKPGVSGQAADDEPQGEEASVLSRKVQNQPDDLPIELISLTDRYYTFFLVPSAANSCIVSSTPSATEYTLHPLQ